MVGVRIPGLELAGSAVEEQRDQRLGPFRASTLRGPGIERGQCKREPEAGYGLLQVLLCLWLMRRYQSAGETRLFLRMFVNRFCRCKRASLVIIISSRS